MADRRGAAGGRLSPAGLPRRLARSCAPAATVRDVLVALLLAGCTRAPGPALATTTEHSDAPRRVAGVVLDPTSAPPRSRLEAVSQEGIVTLRAPLGRDAVFATLGAFFEAIAREDLERLSDLLVPGAMLVDARRSSSEAAHNLLFHWRQRFGRLEYGGLIAEALFRPQEVETFDGPHAGVMAAALRMTEDLEGEDLVVRVRVRDRRAVAERLLGETVTILLRRKDDRFLILRVAEVVPP